ncbi:MULTISPECIES: exonuclease domain-containing protein [unclassified Vibrio]|uniref:exonuclease domain-containing protein n=1 Tax=unclassified Vibrio TaxID=2614977 RepID=UPI0021D1B073|nr:MULTISPECIES: exonuclease domain-containing protein [unclassified Vibrio]MDW1605627.1 exonuclease domain-containing protein [Vibrio sp. Vb2977]MDW1668601.1 exonuclease domain-containing protein [Vibrio sp. Vb2978]MDW1682622.1 exonuclease domain-containing protein [Vibrio sp. Vb2942]
MRVIVIDTETTGLKVLEQDRIIEIAAVEVVDGKLTSNYYQTYINPQGKAISRKAKAIHGIEEQDLLDKPLFKDIAPSLLAFCKDADEIACYNSDFDLSGINKEFERFGLSSKPFSDIPSLCLMKHVKEKYFPHRKYLKLDEVCDNFGVDRRSRTMHGALIDAQITAQLYVEVIHNRKIQIPKPTIVSKFRYKGDEHKTTRPLPRSFKDPDTGNYIQLNFCKNPNCENYGVPAKNPKLKKDGTRQKPLGNSYTLLFHPKHGLQLECRLCKTRSVLINNRGFVEESNRLKHIHRNQPICCPDASFVRSRRKNRCRNTTVNFLEKPERYNLKDRNVIKRGRRKIEVSRRLECRACKQSFFVTTFGEKKQKRSDINILLFHDLMGKGILNRMVEKYRHLGCSRSLIHQKIEFFYRQCIEFDSWQINRNIEKLKGKSLSLSMDRQHYLVNWAMKEIGKPTKMVNTSTADNESGFVFAATMNFDSEVDSVAVTKDSIKQGDFYTIPPRTKYPQYVIYNEDIDEDDDNDKLPTNIPLKGLMVRQTYSAMAHLELLKPIYDAAEHVSLFADDDSGFELAIALTLQALIEQRKVFPVLVREERNNASSLQDTATRNEVRKTMFEQQNISLASLKGLKGEEYKKEIARLTKDYWLSKANSNRPEKSEWLVHPFPSTDRVIEVKPLINVFADASHPMWHSTSGNQVFDVSTTGVDNFFQSVRRRLNILERPITSATNGKRWNGYASYNPKYSMMLLEIFRVFMNYVHTDFNNLEKKGGRKHELQLEAKTPAQKLGLVDKVFSVQDILEFSAAKHVSQSK